MPEASGESPFCPECGAPQLSLALENQSTQTSGDAAYTEPGTAGTGAIPPPSPRQVEWKTAIRCSVVVAAIGAALCVAAMRIDALTYVRSVWIMSASLITLGFYQKRRPTARMDARVGARIGVVVGICLALELGIALAGVGLVARFGLHAMGNFDAQITDDLAQLQRAIQQKSMQQPNAPIPAGWLEFIATPEFRGGYTLFCGAFATAGLVVMSVLFGAFHGLLRMRRPVG